MSIVNIAAYRFVDLSISILPELQIKLKTSAKALDLKGSILLSTEGINLFLSGEEPAIASFKAFLNTFSCFQNLSFKESLSSFHPFKKMLVKLKKEIIPFGIDSVNPNKHTAPYVSPDTLKTWLKESTHLILLDTRNSFEVELGSFKNALNLNIKRFRDFPEIAKKLPDQYKKRPVVTFCTGGIRCEKASAYLLQIGFTEVYQLEGGILNYFEKCGKVYYEGSCFVFDSRVTVTSSLKN